MEALSNKAVLLLIDVQKGFDSPIWGKRNNPEAESNMSKLLTLWRQTFRPVIHIQHMSIEPDSPLSPGQPGNEFKDIALPFEGEHIEQKTVNSAFIGTNLEQYLRQRLYNTIVIVGLTTDHCVSTSTRMAGNLGFKTFVVADAAATFDRRAYDNQLFEAEKVHAVALASLHKEFATVIRTAAIIGSLETSAYF
jgi:nicotinamidase-related amidase